MFLRCFGDQYVCYPTGSLPCPLVWQRNQKYEEEEEKEVSLYQKRRNATLGNCNIFLFTRVLVVDTQQAYIQESHGFYSRLKDVWTPEL